MEGNSMTFVFSLADKREVDVSLVGGKASSLAELSRVRGIQVPPAVVITSLAYEAFLEAHPEIAKQIEHLEQLTDQKQIQGPAQAIQEAMRSAEVPDSLRAAIIKAYEDLSCSIRGKAALVSVRSSAIIFLVWLPSSLHIQ
ncbi:TPA: hypothetical protein EYP66_20845, partial [Candidatus Poribacteria bacterium]|nr:hypothetical protein [Candidatus Poribacteria bacterium]